MTKVHSTPSRRNSKPKKPHPDFPLTPHPSGQWCKKVLGKLHYFGRDPDEALNRWLDEKDALLAGRKPRPRTGDPSATPLRDLVNRFMEAKDNALRSGELSIYTWRDYQRACEELVKAFGATRPVADLAHDDFAKLRRLDAKMGKLPRQEVHHHDAHHLQIWIRQRHHRPRGEVRLGVCAAVGEDAAKRSRGPRPSHVRGRGASPHDRRRGAAIESDDSPRRQRRNGKPRSRNDAAPRRGTRSRLDQIRTAKDRNNASNPALARDGRRSCAIGWPSGRRRGSRRLPGFSSLPARGARSPPTIAPSPARRALCSMHSRLEATGISTGFVGRSKRSPGKPATRSPSITSWATRITRWHSIIGNASAKGDCAR